MMNSWVSSTGGMGEAEIGRKVLRCGGGGRRQRSGSRGS